MTPHLGKVGMPYAKPVRAVKALHGAKPDPGLLIVRLSWNYFLIMVNF